MEYHMCDSWYNIWLWQMELPLDWLADVIAMADGIAI